MQEWIVELEESGYQLTDDAAQADFGILNTCSVTEKAEKEILRFIQKVYHHSEIKWLITGCTVTRDKERLAENFASYVFFDNSEKAGLVEYIKKNFPTPAKNIIYHSAYRSRIFLKIHDGCNFRCTYCIVPLLRGKSRSLPPEEIIHKARYFADLGFCEIVLTGVNLSSYGYDLFPRKDLLTLIRSIAQIQGISFVRLSSLDPRYLKYDFVRELSQTEKICDSFHFSFQSGSNPVLRKMKRGSKVFEYEKVLDHFRFYFPEANLGADFLLGFPEESEKEFRETLEFFQESTLNYAHVFPFSPREGTKAALLEQLPVNIVQKRVQEMREVNRIKRQNYRQRFLDRILHGVLTEEDPNYSMVVTKNYLSVRTPPEQGLRKKPVRVLIKSVINENICEGVTVKDV